MEVDSSGEDTASVSISVRQSGVDQSTSCLELAILWSKDEVDRIGECCFVSGAMVLGRGPQSEVGDPPKAEFFRRRPGFNEPTGTLCAPTASRRQWLVTPRGHLMQVVNVGKQEMLHNGFTTRSCLARPGDTLAIAGTALFLVSERTRTLPHSDIAPFGFGHPDALGLIGESEPAWVLRRTLLDLAGGDAHVLLLGPSGSGKELCAKALHLWSQRASSAFVSRNAATLPSGILEAELFGNAANYPQSGMPARCGLVGAAHGGTLFIDEVGELPEREQATLLRVLDSGEYQRLGEERVRRSTMRVVAATNRPEGSLKFDLLARFAERLVVPDLNQRRGDIPLIARDLLMRLNTQPVRRLAKRPSLALVDALVRHRYTTNVRELEKLLRLSWRHSDGLELQLTPEVEKELNLPLPEVEISAEAVRVALAESRSSSEAARRLGLPSRFALHRLSKKLGVTVV